MRPKRLLTAVLCVCLAVPPASFAQTAPRAASSAGASSSTSPGTANVYSSSAAALSGDAPANFADGVFGVYGGADARFANRPGEKVGMRAPLNALELPDLGDGSGGTLTPQAERRVGERMMRDLRREPDYLDDWLMRDYLNSIASKLSTAAVSQYLGGYLPDFDLFPVRDPQINAFSMPGGFIGVNTGLIATSQTESELASVIGHEMGHVLQRHIARMLGTSERSGYAALAAMLLGLLAGVVARSGDLGMGIAMSGQAFAVDSQLRFSRSAEHEADRVGFQMLSAAGYDPYAMATFFERLDRSAMGDAGVPPYARTHPLTGERIADMEDRARRVPYRQPRQSSEYGFVRARARVLQVNSASDYRDIVSRLRAEIDDQTALNAAANWYGIALAQTLLGDYGPAGESLATSRRLFEGELANAAQAASEVKNEDAQTRSLSPEPATNAAIRITSAKPIKPTSIAPASRSSPSLDVLAAEIARRAGRADEAVRLADTAQRRWPSSHAAIETHLRALLSAQRFDDARTLARAETRADPAQPDWWRYLAEACVGANDPLEQHRAMAEKFALDGAWPSAIRQLKEARDVKSANFYDLSTISARLRDFESRYKEEREQEKDGGFS